MNTKIKAMVMAAGMGSRLEPITLHLPKPLIPILNKPLMDIILERLSDIEITDVISNTYYLSEQIINRYENNNLGINFNYITEEELSGTAGGLKKCEFFFKDTEDFVVMSGDILTDADIKRGIEIHKSSGAIATIGVKEIPHEFVSHFGVVVTDSEGYITEFQEKPSLEEAKSNMINTGIYIFNRKIFEYIPENTFYDFAKNVFPKLLAARQINVFEIDGYWSDVGTIEQYKQTIKDVFECQCDIGKVEIIKTATGSYTSECANIANCTLEGYNVIGKDCKIGNNVYLKDCVAFNNATIADDTKLENCIILPEYKQLPKSDKIAAATK